MFYFVQSPGTGTPIKLPTLCSCTRQAPTRPADVVARPSDWTLRHPNNDNHTSSSPWTGRRGCQLAGCRLKQTLANPQPLVLGKELPKIACRQSPSSQQTAVVGKRQAHYLTMELFLQEDLCKDLRDIRVVNLIVSMYVE